MKFEAELLAKATDRSAVFGIVGLGYVGLPLAVEVARAGCRAVGFDILPNVCEAVNAGTSHVMDVPSKNLAEQRNAGRIEATTDMSRLADVDVISICVPTPLSKSRDPDVSYVSAAGEAVSNTIRAGQVVILESTTYPGTTREVLLPLLEQHGLRAGEDFFLAFSPERVDPGNRIWTTRNTPKVFGGLTEACQRVVSALYGVVFDQLVSVSSPEAAELVKLLENTFRTVNIGLANEMAIVCDKLGVDVWEVVNAAATKPFGFMKFTPGPGLGGHCIPIDPHYLAWKMRGLNYKTRFIEVAGEVNAEMPGFWTQKVIAALNEDAKSVRGSTILVLGVSYKRDVDDLRESPALDVIRLLQQQGADVRYSDPHVPTLREEGITLSAVDLTTDEVRNADCVIVVTDHSDVNYRMVATHARRIVDTRNAIRNSGGAQ